MTLHERRHSSSRRSRSPDEPLADDVLLGRVASGDRGSLTEIYDRHAEAVYGLALQILMDPARAELVTFEVFLSLWRTAGSFDPSLGSPHTWLLTATHRQALALLRLGPDTPDAGLELQVTRQPLTRPLGAVTRQQETPLHLGYFGGLSCPEIAQALGVPVSTVQRRILTGLRALTRGAGGPTA